MGLVSWHKSSWEEPTISRVVSDVNRAGYKVVVVDDGSSDGTADHAGAAGARLIVHPFNPRAPRCRPESIMRWRKSAEYVATFDADGQHRVSDIEHLVDALIRERADFALDSWASSQLTPCDV